MRSLFKYFLVPFLLALISSAYAATPDAGSILQQLQQEEKLSRPAPKFDRTDKPQIEQPEDPQALKVLVTKIIFTGNTNIKAQELENAFQSFLNKQHSFQGIEKIARMVGEYYRGKGLWAKAILPPQSLQNGELIIEVIEGELGSIQIEHKEDKLRFSETKSREYLLDGQTEGEVFNIHAFQRAIKNLDAVPGVTAAAILQPGKLEGQTDVLVRMANTPLTAGSVRLDNHGSRSTSWENTRVTGLLNIDSPFEMGEQVNLQVVHSRGLDVFTAGATYPLGSDGTRLGIKHTQVRYNLGEPLASLDGKGDSQTTMLYVTKPLVQENELTVNGQLDISHNNYHNELNGSVSSDKSLNYLQANLNTSWPDNFYGGGANTMNVSYMVGDVDLGGEPSNLSADLSAAHTQGNFSKMSLQANRLHTITDETQLWISFLGQYAFDNLDSGQKMSLGGASAVRAYPSGEASGDHGALLTLELRHMFKPDIQGMVFYDHGWIQQNKETWTNWNSGSTTPNDYDLKGFGLGVKWQAAQDTEVVGYLSTRIGSNPAADANGNDNDGTKFEPRAWLSLVKQF